MQTNNNGENGFFFSYSAKEQAEIKKIREKYQTGAKCDDKIERLRRLDASVTHTAMAVAIVIGIVGALILGFGMSLIMTDLGDAMKMDSDSSFVIGLVMGLFGCALVITAYPIYKLIVNIKRKRIAPEIIRLSDELMR